MLDNRDNIIFKILAHLFINLSFLNNNSQKPLVIILRINFLVKDDFFNIKKINFLGNSKILKLVLQYLTKMSVRREIDKTSNKEYSKSN